MLKDKKVLILIALIIFFPIFTIILSFSLQSCGRKASSYDAYEKNMIRATERYVKTNNILPKNEGEIVKVSLNTLVEKGYIKGTEKALKDDSCSGSVSVRLNGSSMEATKGGFLNYIPNLECKKHSTQTLIKLLSQNLVTEGSGLYKVDNGYLFKGNKPKNYITFFDKHYRIMGIDHNGLAILIKSDTEPIARIWDNKYNLEVKQSYGKSIYKDSMILQYINSDYLNKKKITEEARKHIVAGDTCIGRRAKDNFTISKAIDCQEVLENQLIRIMSVSDYSLASLDSDCTSLNSRSCNNYNYLKDFTTFTWTSNPVSDNTYEIYFNAGGVTSYQNANQYNNYNLVFLIDSNEKVYSGSGTEEDPYVIK